MPRQRDEGAVNLWAVGYITGSFGIKGFVKAKPLTDTPGRFKRLRQVYMGLRPEAVVEDEVKEVEVRERYILLKLRSAGDKTGADKLKGQYIFVDEADIVLPEGGRYFIHDIIGCRVETADGRQIGIVKEVYNAPAHDLWEIECGEKSFMIPVVKEFIRSVDRDKRIITVNVIDGLTDV